MHRSTRTTRTLTAAAAALAIALAGCGTDTGGDALEFEDVRARANLETVGRSAIYFQVNNPTDTDAELVAVDVPADIAGYTELHETVEVDGDAGVGGDGMSEDMDSDMGGDEMDDDMEMEGMGGMTMRQLDGPITIPAGGTVVLEPGGLHVMVMDLTEDLEDGTEFQAVLRFDDDTERTVDVVVTTTP